MDLDYVIKQLQAFRNVQGNVKVEDVNEHPLVDIDYDDEKGVVYFLFS